MQLADSMVEVLLNDSFARCDELIGLRLDRNSIASIPPRVFENCTKLRTLDLTVHRSMLMDGESFYGLENLEILRIGRLTVSNTIFEHLPRIRRLHLTNIIGIESNALRRMTQLEIIEISDNALSLSVIQDAIDGLGSSVLRISLNRNRYTSVDFRFFEQFVNLEELELIGNQLTTIEANSFTNYRNLKILRLHSNNISMLTNESFAGLQSLETLTLNHNRLTYVISDAFHDLVNLRFLELSNNIIPNFEEESFNGLQSLESLLINNVQLTNLIPGTFEHLPNLQVLQIIDGNISRIQPNTFAPLKNLRVLHLAGNLITRLNSNSFAMLPALENFFVSHRVWNHDLNEIERNFFANFPRLVQFGDHSGRSCNGNINSVVNMTLVDFTGPTVFDACFSNWDAAHWIPSTGDPNTTPSNNAATGIAKFSFSMALIVIRVLQLLF